MGDAGGSCGRPVEHLGAHQLALCRRGDASDSRCAGVMEDPSRMLIDPSLYKNALDSLSISLSVTKSELQAASTPFQTREPAASS